MVPDRWELGSEFHWDEDAMLDAGSEVEPWLPGPHTLFASGSGALAELMTLLGRPRRLHLPSYFCMGVAEGLAAEVDVAWYRELPDGAGPHLDTLDAEPGDAVLVMNLFGRGDRTPWDAWARANPLVTVVEDHTHDPISDWARASTATYCVASLRKTLPVPDGALVWSPRGEPLPTPVGGASAAGALKLSAMMLKAAWLRGKDVDKSVFRTLQQVGEVGLHCATTAPTTVTRTVLGQLDAWRLRSTRADNARALVKSLPADESRWQPLTWGPSDAVPFNVQLLCESERIRDALLAHLGRERIFAPVHWRQSPEQFGSRDAAAVDYASRLLTLPVDHRYGEPDIHQVLSVLDAF